jgi:hypothetical protein
MKLHGPWTDRDLGSGEHRAEQKGVLWSAARLKQCGCELCAKHGQRGVSERCYWLRRYEAEGNERIYIEEIRAQL